MLRGIILFAVGAIIVVAGLVGYQAVFANSANNVSAADSAAARDQFLSDRGGGVITGANGLANPGGGGGNFPAGDGLVGTVASVGADSITVTGFDSATTTVQFAADATITRSASATLADVKPGDQVYITASGDTPTASSVQIGGTTGLGGGRGGANGGANFTAISGAVQAVDAASITVQTASGATTVAVDANTQYRSQQTITLADLKVGDTVAATGALNGDTFEATALRVGAMGGFGGMGGPTGRGGGAPGAAPMATPAP